MATAKLRRRSVFVAAFLVVVSPAAAQQQWNDSATTALVQRALVGRRSASQDTGLRSYAAVARGVVTFVTEFAPGPTSVRRVVKGDELQVEVYWERPDRSKQLISRWRDSTFLPTDLGYHRDHLALVSDDLGSTIRIGDGDEIRDLPHPLSDDGVGRYDFRITDSLTFRTGASRFSLVGVMVRPRDPTAPGVVGTLYLDVDRAAVVRSTLSFTPAAYIDPNLEDIVVRLERSLVEGRFWLPYRQEIEIRRRSAVADLPFRGIIRGVWEVGDYRLNEPWPARVVASPQIGGLRAPGGTPLGGSLMAAIDSSLTVVGAADLERAREAVSAALRGRLADGLPALRIGAGGLSELVRVTGVEGLRIGVGGSFRGRFGLADRIVAGVGYGAADHRVTGSVAIGRRIGPAALTMAAQRRVADVGDFPGASGLVNSLAAQEGGRDLGHYVLLERVGVEADWARSSGRVGVSLARERALAVVVAAAPARGAFAANPDIGGPPIWVGSVRLERSGWRAAAGQWAARIAAEVGAGGGNGRFGRASGSFEGEFKAPGGWMEFRGFGGVGLGSLPSRRAFLLGGPGTVPGLGFREFGGRRAGWLAAVWAFKVPGPSLSFGRLGRTAPQMLVGPLVAVGAAWGILGPVGRPSAGLRPAVGAAATLFDRFLRIEIGQCLRCSSGPTLAVDLSRQLWPLF